MSRVRNPIKSTIKISNGSSIDMKTFLKLFKRDKELVDIASSGQKVSEKNEKAPVVGHENEIKEHNNVGTWSFVELRKIWSKRIRWLTLVGCLVAVVVQLYICYGKLRLPPVTTHTRFHVNDSLWYPAVTICREPPFRFEVLDKYHLGASPRYTSEWRYFPWDEITLEELYTEATFSADEVFLLYGLNGEVHHVELTSSFFFESGSCHTLSPKVTSRTAGSTVGYSILVTHSGLADEVNPEIPLSVGWQIYVHEPSETWTENKMQSLGRQQAFFIEVGEEVHVRLSVEEFMQTNIGLSRECVNELEGGEVRCAERCRWKQFAVNGCAAPWLPGLDLPDCKTYNDTLRLIQNYLLYDDCSADCCGCAASCRVVRYDALPVIRKPYPAPMSQIYIFFSSRLVTLMEERPAYDWSSFLAEMGGSLGFLLGLNVLQIICMVERSFEFVAAKIPSVANTGEGDKVEKEIPSEP